MNTSYTYTTAQSESHQTAVTPSKPQRANKGYKRMSSFDHVCLYTGRMVFLIILVLAFFAGVDMLVEAVAPVLEMVVGFLFGKMGVITVSICSIVLLALLFVPDTKTETK